MDAGVTFDPNYFAVNADVGDVVVDTPHGCGWADQTRTVDARPPRLPRLDSKRHWQNRFVVVVVAVAQQHNWRPLSRKPATIDGVVVVDLVRVLALDHLLYQHSYYYGRPLDCTDTHWDQHVTVAVAVVVSDAEKYCNFRAAAAADDDADVRQMNAESNDDWCCWSRWVGSRWQRPQRTNHCTRDGGGGDDDPSSDQTP